MHGWIHERNSLLAEADERELMRRAMDTLTEITGRKPVGMRTPSWDLGDSHCPCLALLGPLTGVVVVRAPHDRDKAGA